VDQVVAEMVLDQEHLMFLQVQQIEAAVVVPAEETVQVLLQVVVLMSQVKPVVQVLLLLDTNINK
jgi:hypothetical protein